MKIRKIIAFISCMIITITTFAKINIPGTNEADQLETLGTMAKTFDVVIFTWGAKIAAAIVFLLAGWAIKENRLGVALLCLCAGFLMLFAPKLATEIQSLAGITSLFGG